MSDFKYQPFSGPIPGQSLTMKKGNQKWEKPPKFTNRDKAMDFLIQQMLQPDKVVQIVGMLDKGYPIEMLIRPILFGGFMEGFWTMDLSVMLAKPLAAFISLIYHFFSKGKKPKMTFNEGKANKTSAQILAVAKPNTNLSPQEITNAAPQLAKQAKGMMAKG